MFKRVIWMGTGVVVGAAGSFWAKHKVEQTVERYLPEQVADRAVASARGLGATVKAAASEGRDAMRATEAELRARVEERTFVGDRPAPAAPERAAGRAPGASRRTRPPGPAGLASSSARRRARR